jgi:toxin CcdB
MAQYAVHRNPNTATRVAIPFLLDVQADLLAGLATRLVVPLYLPGKLSGDPIRRLTPTLEFQGRPLVAMVTEIAGVPRRTLGPEVGNLAEARKEILEALELAFTGV